MRTRPREPASQLTSLAGAKVHDLMAQLIDRYFADHLNLSWDDAVRLHKEYYRNYGLAIEGLVRHHKIDPLEYNTKVDDALPLEGIIKPNPALRQLLHDIDRSKVKLWLLTNAYVNHAKRVVRLLEIEDMFEGLTYCDYSSTPLICKPHRDMYDKAMREACVASIDDCFFVGKCPSSRATRVPRRMLTSLSYPDDSYVNCKEAQGLGWTTAHLVEEDVSVPKTMASKYQIRHLEELRSTFPQFFKPRASPDGCQAAD